MKPLVLITNRFDTNLKLKLKIYEQANFQYVHQLEENKELIEQASGLIIRSSTSIDHSFLSQATNLKFIITATSGFDHIDLSSAKQKGVRCFHVPETQSVAAAELTILHILGTSRKLTLSSSQLHKGDWQRSLLLGEQLAGKTLGIVGLGRVGQEVASRAHALGLQVIAHDPYISEHDPKIKMFGFEELMRSSDIVTFHVPKTKKTKHMIKKETLAWMNTSATLINMSRGDVVHEVDLVNHLTEHPDFKAGLDVFAAEPLTIKSKLLSLSNVLLTPHVGASTVQALKASSQVAVDKALALLKEEPVSGELPPKELWFEQ